MIHKGNRARGGTMGEEIQSRVDSLLDEFAQQVNEISDSRHLQRGIARSSLPCSMIAVVDKTKLMILAQFRPGNLSSTYLHAPEIDLAEDQALSKATWEFGFEDPFVLQFPVELLSKPTNERAEALKKIAEEHVDSEFLRFMNLLNFLKARPIFGNVPLAMDEQICAVLTPPQGDRIYEPVRNAAESNKLTSPRLSRIRKSKRSIREAWITICDARVVVADLTGLDPDVLYGLGMAHAVGKDTILIYPAGSEEAEIPRVERIAYDSSDLQALERSLEAALRTRLSPLINE